MVSLLFSFEEWTVGWFWFFCGENLTFPNELFAMNKCRIWNVIAVGRGGTKKSFSFYVRFLENSWWHFHCVKFLLVSNVINIRKSFLKLSAFRDSDSNKSKTRIRTHTNIRSYIKQTLSFAKKKNINLSMSEYTIDIIKRLFRSIMYTTNKKGTSQIVSNSKLKISVPAIPARS